MPDSLYILAGIAVCALCPVARRVAPFARFGGGRQMPPAVRRLAIKLPAAIIAVLVVYCLKALPDSSLPASAATLVSVAAVVVLHLWKRNTLLSIAGGTILYMLLLRLI